MRDPTDHATAEIPGVEPPPAAPPPRLSIAERRAGIGYMGPRQAPTCRHCQHRPAEAMRCGLGDFPVELGGTCPSWTAAGPAA